MGFVNVDELWVKYGRFVAVKQLSFKIEKGDIFGFIGPNGAGKSSTIKVLATLQKPAGGKVLIDDIDVSRNPELIKRKIGYVPDYFGSYDDMNVHEFLQFFAAAYKVADARREKTIDDVLELTDLPEKKKAPVSGLSRGMKQRLSLARVLLHDPDLLLLDEPACGLDPRARIEMRELLKELCNMGKTILISSHILSELSELCNRIGIIEQGKMVAQGSLKDIYDELNIRQKVHIRLANHEEAILKEIATIPEVVAIREDIDRITVEVRQGQIEIEVLHEKIFATGARLQMFQPESMDMETVFMKLTEGKTQ